MNFQQLRYVRAAVQNNLNLTEVANVLSTSQSGVSKQIKELEVELGIEIFVRRGKRLVGLTKAGEGAAKVIDNLLAEAENLKRLSQQFSQTDKGNLVIATTHNQARYTIPQPLKRFIALYPDVEIELRQGTPKYVATLLARGVADVGIATEALDEFPELQTYSCFTWRHVVIVPVDHPLTLIDRPGLDDVARYPIITYNPEFSGRAQIDAAFEAADLSPDIRLTAMDADVIKTYVQLGLGVGIVAEMALVGDRGLDIIALHGSSEFFGRSVTKMAVQRGVLLRNYAYKFMQMLAPHFHRAEFTGAANPISDDQHAILSFSERLDLHADAEGSKEGVFSSKTPQRIAARNS
jgi:DNA-binding transcriptional LysR family regulator